MREILDLHSGYSDYIEIKINNFSQGCINNKYTGKGGGSRETHKSPQTFPYKEEIYIFFVHGKRPEGRGRGDKSLYSPTKQYWGECMLKQGSGGEGFLRRSKHLNNSDIFFWTD